MVQANETIRAGTGFKASVIVGLIAMLVISGMVAFKAPVDNSVDIDELASAVASRMPTAATVDVTIPTAAEIAALIPTVEDTDNQKIQELWDEVYSVEVGDLEELAKEVCIEQFLDDNDMDGNEFEDGDVFELLEGFHGELDGVYFDKEYADDREVTVTNLGLDEEDDRAVTIISVIRVDVEPDLDDEFRDKVYINCEVTSDDEDLEAELTYSL